LLRGLSRSLPVQSSLRSGIRRSSALEVSLAASMTLSERSLWFAPCDGSLARNGSKAKLLGVRLPSDAHFALLAVPLPESVVGLFIRTCIDKSTFRALPARLHFAENVIVPISASRRPAPDRPAPGGPRRRAGALERGRAGRWRAGSPRHSGTAACASAIDDLLPEGQHVRGLRARRIERAHPGLPEKARGSQVQSGRKLSHGVISGRDRTPMTPELREGYRTDSNAAACRGRSATGAPAFRRP
jgi:hypothetical protein